MKARLPSQRGFTLVELLVSVVVTGILAAGAVALLSQQQRGLQASAADRAIQEAVRTGLGQVASSLRRAGFGVEPAVAFDFDRYNCAQPVLCRDAIDGPDEVVFYSRDPRFKTRLSTAPAATQIVIQGGLQAPLYSGQILQLMCPSASASAYVTVGATVAANWTPPAAAPATTTIPLLAGTGVFPQQNGLAVAAGSCFQSLADQVRVYRVDRYRYYVQSFPDTDAGNASGTRPYLMLDRGLSDATGARVEPIAPDVEDLQVEYLFVDPATGATRVVGATSGTRLASSTTSIDLAATPPPYAAPTGDPARTTNHPANIRAVRLSVIARSPRVDITKTAERRIVDVMRSEGDRLPAGSNRPVVTRDAGYVRIRVETTEAVRNMDVRAPFYDP